MYLRHAATKFSDKCREPHTIGAGIARHDVSFRRLHNTIQPGQRLSTPHPVTRALPPRPAVGRTSSFKVQLLQPEELCDGDGCNKLLVYLPGTDGTGQAIRPQISGLRQLGFDVWCLYIPPDDRSDWDQLTTQVTLLLRRLVSDWRSSHGNATAAAAGAAPPRITIVSESFGCCLALRVAASAAGPELLEQVVCVNPATAFRKSLNGLSAFVAGTNLLSLFPKDWYSVAQTTLLPLLVDSSRVDESNAQLLRSMIEMNPPASRQAFGFGNSPGDASSDEGSGAEERDGGAGAGSSSSSGSMAGGSGGIFHAPAGAANFRVNLMKEGDLDEAALARVSSRVLLITSARDRMLPAIVEGARLERALPNARRVILPDSGHAALLERGISLSDIMVRMGFAGGDAMASSSSNGYNVPSGSANGKPPAVGTAAPTATSRSTGATARDAGPASEKAGANGLRLTGSAVAGAVQLAGASGGGAVGPAAKSPAAGTAPRAGQQWAVAGGPAGEVGGSSTFRLRNVGATGTPPQSALNGGSSTAANGQSSLPTSSQNGASAVVSSSNSAADGAASSSRNGVRPGAGATAGRAVGAAADTTSEAGAAAAADGRRSGAARDAAFTGAAGGGPASEDPATATTSADAAGTEPSAFDQWCQNLGPWRDLVSPMVLGFENLPATDSPAFSRPMLLVGNHQKMGFYDTPLLVYELYVRGYKVRGLAHPGHWAGPVGPWFEQFGTVKASPMAAFKLLKRKEKVLLFPGGAKEVVKKRGQEYTLLWKETPDFVRLAARCDALIVPFAAVGADDAYDVVMDTDEVLAHPVLGPLARNLLQRVDSTGTLDPTEAMFPITRLPGLGVPTPIPIPNLQRLYFKFGAPIDTRSLIAAGGIDNAAEVQQAYDAIKLQVTELMAELLAVRAEDADNKVGNRLGNAVKRLLPVFGNSTASPASPPPTP